VQAPDVATLARAIPGFGGFFLDHGVPTVYVSDDGQRGTVERALGGFARARGLAPSQIHVLRGRFRYGDLDRWVARVSDEVFAEGDVVFVDLDEAANRVLVAVEPGASHAKVRSLAARLGVPAEALVVRETEPIHYVATLQDRVRPVVAGLQIHFGNFLCSLGFNAVSGGQKSFVTASHCTNVQGGTEGRSITQTAAERRPRLDRYRSGRSRILPGRRLPEEAGVPLQRRGPRGLRERDYLHARRDRPDQRPQYRDARHRRILLDHE